MKEFINNSLMDGIVDHKINNTDILLYTKFTSPLNCKFLVFKRTPKLENNIDKIIYRVNNGELFTHVYNSLEG
jgi:hypothetical protein